MATLDTKLDRVLGAKSAKALGSAFGMATAGDLLRHYPRRLADRGKLTDFSDLRIGEHVTVLAKTVSVTVSKYRPKRGGGRPAARTEVRVTDGVDDLYLTFFRQVWKAEELRPGTIAWFSGKVTMFNSRRQLSSPTCEVIGRGVDLADFDDERLQRWWPIYPATSTVSSKTIHDSVSLLLDQLDPVPDPLPAHIREQQLLLSYDDALRLIHRAADPVEWQAAHRRLRFDEALVLQTLLAQRRHELRSLAATARPPREGGLRARFDASLPFELTAGQVEVGREIEADLSQSHPMHRLLQGEVGSGKTVVALRAMLQVLDAGGQAALLAPTEVLASQHYRSIVSMLGPMAEGGMLGGADDATRVVLLTGSMSAARRRSVLLDAASGTAGIVVGTHALLEGHVQLAELGLVVVDEQHRFGVEQRAALAGKASSAPPHVLVMTATPIPRTVAMTIFGDLNVSTLRDLPAGRVAIQTTVVPAAERPEWLARVWQRVREEVSLGRQVYVVCPRIGTESESESATIEPEPDGSARRPPLAVADVAAHLAAGPLAGLRVSVLHGRLPGDEKDDIMQRFAAGDIDVLVATTVIEVGVDVANASVMVVMDAERFGVSQLHQLRGRIGRGSVPGLCLLVTDAPEATRSRDRLDGVAATSDGFALARLDLESRREGDVLGANQSGRRSSLRLLSVLRDEGDIVTARGYADEMVLSDPSLASHPGLAAAVEELVATEQAEYMEKS
ncbi:MAG TPA: ATP-dependent DNA helicase RecG [Nocardioidaceae bacterium]|nr:ATP-dependent DNA helicase RecG [Nocardioidaceae bacterium]